MIRNAFVERCGGVGEADDAVKEKLNETIRFYEYTQQVADLCNHNLKKELPVPDSDYVLSNIGYA